MAMTAERNKKKNPAAAQQRPTAASDDPPAADETGSQTTPPTDDEGGDEPKPPEDNHQVTPATVLLELPYAEVQEVSFGLHIDARLTAEQSRMLRSIAAGCDRDGRRLANGRPVFTPTDALKYLLEQLTGSK